MASPPQIYDTFNAPNVGVKTLIYGAAGMGKTPLCATAPQPIILSVEDGLLSLRRQHVPFMVIRSFADLKAAREALSGSYGASFKTIALDSVSEIADVCLTENKTKNKGAFGAAYGDMADLIVEEFRMFRSMPKHVVFTAQMGNWKDGLTGAMMWGPAFPGNKLDQKVPYLFDEMWQLLKTTDPATGQDYPVLRTQPSNQFQAKDRSGSLAPWEYSDLTYLFNKIMNGV